MKERKRKKEQKSKILGWKRKRMRERRKERVKFWDGGGRK